MSSVKKNAAFVALRPPSNAHLCKALLPVVSLTLNTEQEIRWHCSQRLPYSQRLKTVAEAATCEWRLCAHPLFASSALSRARRLHVQHRSQRQPHHHSAKQATHNSKLEAPVFIYPPSVGVVWPPSAPPRLQSLHQRHLLLLRLHGVQRLPGGHAPQRHQQRERRRHKHNRHLELGRVCRPLMHVGEDVVA